MSYEFYNRINSLKKGDCFSNNNSYIGGAKNDNICHFDNNAEVVKLVDALRSGRSDRKVVGVRVPPSAF